MILVILNTLTDGVDGLITDDPPAAFQAIEQAFPPGASNIRRFIFRHSSVVE